LYYICKFYILLHIYKKISKKSTKSLEFFAGTGRFQKLLIAV